jgi:hypothetical protein
MIPRIRVRRLSRSGTPSGWFSRTPASTSPEQQIEALAVQAAVKRASAEAADGLASFLDKRDPPWYPPA